MTFYNTLLMLCVNINSIDLYGQFKKKSSWFFGEHIH